MRRRKGNPRLLGQWLGSRGRCHRIDCGLLHLTPMEIISGGRQAGRVTTGIELSLAIKFHLGKAIYKRRTKKTTTLLEPPYSFPLSLSDLTPLFATATPLNDRWCGKSGLLPSIVPALVFLGYSYYLLVVFHRSNENPIPFSINR
jgi:hypothetical protein